MSKTILGVDIGNSRLKLALLNKGRVTRLVSELLPDGIVNGGRIISLDKMSDFLKETVDKHHIRARRCAVLLPDSRAITHRAVLAAMTEKQLKLNLPYEFSDYLTDSRDQYIYDYALIDMRRDNDGKPYEMELLVTATLKSTIQDYSQMFRWAGFKLVSAVPPECAYGRLLKRYQVEHPEVKDQICCIVDLGQVSSNIYMFNKGHFDVARELEGVGSEQEHIANQTVYDNIVVDIMRAIKFYTYNNGGIPVETIWVCGGGSQNAILIDQLQDDLDLEVRLASDLLKDVKEEQSLLAACTGAISAAQ